jgi:hypothetical protein
MKREHKTHCQQPHLALDHIERSWGRIIARVLGRLENFCDLLGGEVDELACSGDR